LNQYLIFGFNVTNILNSYLHGFEFEFYIDNL